MRIEQTPLQDCFIVHEKVHGDARGYFIETFNQRDFNKASGLDILFVQDNQSRSSKGVLRGLHMQRGAAAQAKLVRVLEGSVLDIAVDLRKGSPSFGQHYAIELTADNIVRYRRCIEAYEGNKFEQKEGKVFINGI